MRKFGNLSLIRARFEAQYQDAVVSYCPHLPTLAASDRPLLESLRTDGIAITSLAALNLETTPQLLTSAQLAQAFLAGMEVESDAFVASLPPSQSTTHSTLLTWGLQPRLLDLIETYLQLPVAYHGVYPRRDLARAIVKRSRLWHTDMEDNHVLKIIVYLNDVDEAGGPFQYLSKSISKQIQQRLGHACGYIRPGQIERLVAQHQWQSCTGPAGTVVIVDTGMLIHRGKVPDRDRYTLFYDYTSRLPRRPYYCKSSLPEPELRQIAQALSQSQQDCVFWREPGRAAVRIKATRSL